MDNEPFIQTADISEIGTIGSLWEELNAHNSELHRRYFGHSLGEIWINKRREFERRGQACLIRFDIVKKGDVPVGYCLSSVNASNGGEIISIYIRPEFRRKGIGRELMIRHLAWMRANEAKHIMLYVHPCNIDAIRFYWQFGLFSNSPLMETCEGGR